MLEFLEDLDRYLAELHCSSTNSSPSTSSSPLNSHELTVMEWIEVTGLVEMELYPFLLPMPAITKLVTNIVALITSE